MQRHWPAESRTDFREFRIERGHDLSACPVPWIEKGDCTRLQE